VSTSGTVGHVIRALLVAAVLLAVRPHPAEACGGGGVTSATSGVLASSQRIFMSVRAATTDVVVQIGVPATTADYGVLIPVPSEPTLDPQPVAEADLVALDEVTAPEIIVHEASSSSGIGCGCGTTGFAKGVPRSGEPDGGVSVSEPVNIGPVEAVVLSADNGDAVAGWLTANGFLLSTEGRAIVAAYVGPGSYFIAVRRSTATASGGPTSIGLHYTMAGAHKKLSLGFARLGAAPSVAFTLFLAAPQPMGPAAPFAAIPLSDLDDRLLAAGQYGSAVALAVTAHDSKAFVMEKAVPGAPVAALGGGLAGLLDAGAVVTRMSTIVAAEALHDDATFTGPYSGDVTGQVHVSALVVAAAVPFPLLVLAALALRRRRSVN
jgi:hypothetical protein